jgi:hypothetical protein
MEFEKVLQKRVRGMAVRILACIEHTLAADLEGMRDDEKFQLLGSHLKIIRSEILNAAGDTTRSLASLIAQPVAGKLSLSREVIAVLNRADVDIVEIEGGGDVPVFNACGDFNQLNKIRREVNAGVVYNKTYTCAGIDDIVNSLMPFLDAAQIAGIKIADGDYREWRDAVCEMYLEGLGNE